MKAQNVIKLNERTEYSMLGQGNTAEIYLYDDSKILKLFRANLPLQMIETEFEIASRVSAQLKYAPKVFGLVEYKNRFGILYEKIDGKDMILEMFRKPHKIGLFSKALAKIHTKIHNSNSDLGLDVKRKLIGNIKLSTDLLEQEKEKIISYINKLPDGKALCHFDFHPGNVMIKNNELFVIDWMTACNGDAAADVARTFLLLRYGELLYANWFVKLIAHIVEKHIGKVYLRTYKKLTGISDAEIKKWLLPVAAARLVEWIPKNEKSKLLKFIRIELSKINN